MESTKGSHGRPGDALKTKEVGSNVNRIQYDSGPSRDWGESRGEIGRRSLSLRPRKIYGRDQMIATKFVVFPAKREELG